MAASGFLSDQKATKESPGEGSGEHQVVLLVARPPVPVYGGAWFGRLAQRYRRGVASDAQAFSRPLPLCGKTGGIPVLSALDAPTRLLPRGAAGAKRCEPVGHGILDAPPFRRTTGQVTMIVRVGRDDSARPAPAPAEADSPCQGEMSQRDKRGRDRQAP